MLAMAFTAFSSFTTLLERQAAPPARPVGLRHIVPVRATRFQMAWFSTNVASSLAAFAAFAAFALATSAVALASLVNSGSGGTRLLVFVVFVIFR